MNKPILIKLKKLINPPISGCRPSGGVSVDTVGIPSLGGENIVAAGGVTYEVIKRIPDYFYRRMPKGKLEDLDVLINKDGAQTGKVGLYKKIFSEAAINEHLFILRPQNRDLLNPVYLYYCLLLEETKNKIERRITGSAQPGLNSQFVANVDIPYFDYKIQNYISNALQTIDQAIEKTEVLIEKYQHIKTGLMHDLFTRGIGSDGKLRPPREQAPELYQQTPIGWIPKEWTVSSLEKVSKRITDGSHQSINREIGLYAQIPFIFVSCIDEGMVFWGKAAYVSKETYEIVSKGRVPHKHMILFTVVGSIGRVAVLTDNRSVAFERNIACISTNDETNPLFLGTWLESSTIQCLSERLSVGNAQKLLSLSMLKKLPVLLPSPDEQSVIYNQTVAINKIIQSNSEQLSKFIDLKSGLMHDLLMGKVQVPINRTETTYV